MGSQKGARSKLADVLADIKNSRVEDEYDYNNHDIAPTPAKRRLAVNYVALSGHTPRQSRSSAANTSSSHQTNQEVKQTPVNTVASATQRTRTYVLKLFDRTVDLAQFTEEDRDDTPLYPICRAWVHSRRQTQTQNNKDSSSSSSANGLDKGNGSPSTTQHESTIDILTDNEILSLPPPKSRMEVMKHFNMKLEDENIDIRIPQSVRDYKRPENVEEMIDKSIHSMDHRECMKQNMERWKKVKREWSEARKLNETRYEDSFNTLQEMFLSS